MLLEALQIYETDASEEEPADLQDRGAVAGPKVPQLGDSAASETRTLDESMNHGSSLTSPSTCLSLSRSHRGIH